MPTPPRARNATGVLPQPAAPTLVQVSYAITASLYRSMPRRPTMSPDGGRTALERPAKLPPKGVAQPAITAVFRAFTCDFGQAAAARGEASTKASAPQARQGFTRFQPDSGEGSDGRRTRSNEYPAGFAISRRFARHPLQIRFRRAHPRLQTRQSLEIQKEPARHLDGKPVPQHRNLPLPQTHSRPARHRQLSPREINTPQPPRAR